MPRSKSWFGYSVRARPRNICTLAQHILAPAMGKATPLGRYGWSSNARNADAAVDIFITSRPLRFFTGVKSKHS